MYNDDVTCDGCIIVPKEFSKILRQIKGIANGKLVLDDESTTQDLGD
jgi:hypothetical protein